MRDTEGVMASPSNSVSISHTLLSLLTVALIVLVFVVGWFRGYKKACDAHGWNLPNIDWKSRARGTHRT